jgi:hypothetical protein
MYPAKQEVQLTAVPATGYYFVGWRDTTTEKTKTVTIPMTCTKQATAIFALITYQLDVNVQPPEGGQVFTESPVPDDGYLPGTKVTLIAVANNGFKFKKWTGDVSGENTSVELTMDGNKEITANFTGKRILSAAWWARTIGLGTGIAAIIVLALLLIIRRIIVKRRTPKVIEPCSLFQLSQTSYYQQIDTDKN